MPSPEIGVVSLELQVCECTKFSWYYGELLGEVERALNILADWTRWYSFY